MDRRLFLRRSVLSAAVLAVGDRLELLDRLTWKRTLFPGAVFTRQTDGLWLAMGNPGHLEFFSRFFDRHLRDGAGVYPQMRVGVFRGEGTHELTPELGWSNEIRNMDARANDVTLGYDGRELVKAILLPGETLRYEMGQASITSWDGSVRSMGLLGIRSWHRHGL